MYKKILLPTDGSEYANQATKHAIWIARTSGAEIIVLNVIETSSLVGLPTEDFIVRIEEILKREGQIALDHIFEIANKENLKAGYLTITSKTEEGSPADVILKTIDNEDIDLVVMGTSGKHGLDRFLLGSVAERVVRSAKCPVLVVH